MLRFARMLRRAREKSGIRQHIATVKQVRRGKCNLVLSVLPFGITATLGAKRPAVAMVAAVDDATINVGVTSDVNIG